MLTDYSHLTEADGSRVTREQLQRMYARYVFAAELCKGKDVLEAACGIGQGLGLLGQKARGVAAGDYTQRLVDVAKAHYGDRFDIRQFDAQSMPFTNGSFDAVILYEAIYYLPRPRDFLAECRRVLRPDGRVIICTANKDWSGFSASPSSYEYFGVPELVCLLEGMGFSTEVFGDCPVIEDSFSSRAIAVVRSVAIKLRLMPDTLKAREKLKRIFFGKLIDMPAELEDGCAEYVRPIRLPTSCASHGYKVLFAVGTLKD